MKRRISQCAVVATFTALLNLTGLFAAAQDALPGGTSRRSEKQPPSVSITPPRIEAFSLRGIRPGESTQAHLLNRWGQPKRRGLRGSDNVWTYQLPGFGEVEVLLRAGRVAQMTVTFDKGLPAGALAKNLNLTGFQPVQTGRHWIFPERGVTLQVGDGKDLPVQQLVLEPLSARHFLNRIEGRGTASVTRNLKDFEIAAGLDPTNASLIRRWSAELIRLGKFEQAGKVIGRALKQEMKTPEIGLAQARLALATGDFAAALPILRKVAENQDASPLARAEAHQQLASATLQTAPGEFKAAMKLCRLAIELAEPQLTNKHDAPTQARATRILIDAHVSAARAIAVGDYRQSRKPQAVLQWLAKAEKLLDHLEQHGGSHALDRLTFYRRTLAAYVPLSGQVQGGEIADRAIRHARALVAKHRDPQLHQMVQWELGLALTHGAAVERDRQQGRLAGNLADSAVSLLQPTAKLRDASPETDYVLGSIYYLSGSIQARLAERHLAACKWFDRAHPLLANSQETIPAGRLDGVGRALVSMGVSYWQENRQDDALKLTDTGRRLIERAVQAGAASPHGLADAYTNLAVMNRKLGRDEQADKFTRMAAQLDAGETQRR